MKVIIAGSRSCTDTSLVARAIAQSPWPDEISAILEGGTAGVDRLARSWGEARGLPVTTVAADWAQGRSAGPRRNRALARDHGAQALILVWNGSSPGSASMLREARSAGLPVFEFRIDNGDSEQVRGRGA